jgi:hypothetical protein
MKKIFFNLAAVITLVILSSSALNAQSDKEIIKSAEEAIKNKDYNLAFQQIITVEKPSKKSPQDILKKSYPEVIAADLKKYSDIKISDADDNKAIMEKIDQMTGFLKDCLVTDSLFKKYAEPDLYKSGSRKKKIESALKSHKSKVNIYMAKIEKQKMLEDSLRLLVQDSIRIADSIARANSPVITSTQVNDQQTNNQPVNKPPENISTQQTNTQPAGTNDGTKKYYIIAGSYTTEAAAQEAVNKLKALGYASEIVGLNAYGSLRISYSSFTNKDEALNELDHIKSEVQADAWLLEK